jgi:L-histidine N-alpha-methyltransferase
MVRRFPDRVGPAPASRGAVRASSSGRALPRFDLVRPRGEVRSTLAADVRAGLVKRPRSIPPKHFYDAAGSALFDAICDLPEYYLTRAERALLERHADAIVDLAGAPATLVELGSGMARKTGLLLSAIARRAPSPTYVPLDISPEALEASAASLLPHHPTLRVRGIVGDFGVDLPRLADVIPSEGARLFAFLGSTIGNLDEVEAPALVRSVAARMTARDAFLLGVDLVKDAGVLHAAYNDAAGVTAKFNLNLLAVVNRELHADFDLSAWTHEARWVPERARIEMHLRSERVQRVTIADLDLRIDFDAGETLLTEISRKFTRKTAEGTLREGGMRLEHFFDDDGIFALALARRV